MVPGNLVEVRVHKGDRNVIIGWCWDTKVPSNIEGPADILNFHVNPRVIPKDGEVHLRKGAPVSPISVQHVVLGDEPFGNPRGTIDAQPHCKFKT